MDDRLGHHAGGCADGPDHLLWHSHGPEHWHRDGGRRLFLKRVAGVDEAFLEGLGDDVCGELAGRPADVGGGGGGGAVSHFHSSVSGRGAWTSACRTCGAAWTPGSTS